MIFEDNRETLGKIATLYYLGEMSQDEIAGMYGISRFKVSRLLKKCREYNIIEFHINNKPEYYRKLEAQLCELMHIERAIIVASGSTIGESKTNVGRGAAKYLGDSLKDGMTVGIDWGTTLQAMVREYNNPRQYRNCRFVQISGSVASQSVASSGYMDGHDIVRNLAVKAGASWSLFPAPYIVKDRLLCRMLLEEPMIRKHIDLFDKIDMAVFGVGSSVAQNLYSFYNSFLTPEEWELLLTYQSAGEVFSSRLTADGQVIETFLTGRVLTISLEQLKRIPNVVVLGAGADKAVSLIAAARGGFFNIMIVDEVTALSILNQIVQEVHHGQGSNDEQAHDLFSTGGDDERSGGNPGET
jgi:deoxyribonucleoside regulator